MRQSHRRALGLRAQSYMLNKIERPEKSHFHLFLSPCLTPALKGILRQGRGVQSPQHYG